jgi:hypothetical protein
MNNTSGEQSHSSNVLISNNFKTDSRRFIDIGFEIKEHNKYIKDLKGEAKNISSRMLSYIKSNKLEENVFTLGQGKLKYGVRTRSATLNREYIYSRLSEFLNDEDLALSATNYIFESRPVSTSEYIKKTGSI